MEDREKQGREESVQGRPVVVCVDDEREILSALERTLGDEPYELLATAEPEQALEWVRSREVGVMISDYRMPDLSGTSLLQVVKALSPSTVRIMLTAYPGDRVVRLAEERGLMHLMAKPWDDAELRRTIREHLASGESGGEPPGSP